MKQDYSDVRGFNYQPSFAYNSYEAWRFFNPGVMELELRRGKEFFPKFNTVRLWLSYDAFRYEEDRQAENFETALNICSKLHLTAVPILFNRWHDACFDNGGIYCNHFIPGSDWLYMDTMYDSYIAKIAGTHAGDERILAWDMCNEPFSYGGNTEFRAFAEPYESEWLRRIYGLCKKNGVTQPVSFSHSSPDPDVIARFADIEDIFFIHPYYYYSDAQLLTNPKEGLDLLLDKYLQLSEKYGKSVLTTETCWGSIHDEIRTRMIENTLSSHASHYIGFIAHALHYSHVADLHDVCDGIVGNPGNLAFIKKDGTLRSGHEIYNKF